MTAYNWYPVADGSTETFTFEHSNYRVTYLPDREVRFTNVRYGSRLIYEGPIPRRWSSKIDERLAARINRLLTTWPMEHASMWWHGTGHAAHHTLCLPGCTYSVPLLPM